MTFTWYPPKSKLEMQLNVVIVIKNATSYSWAVFPAVKNLTWSLKGAKWGSAKSAINMSKYYQGVISPNMTGINSSSS